MATSIAERWRFLSGENHWEGLLDPLDIDLRQYIIHYGEMSQATYDGFNSDRCSKYAGSCRYSRRHFFSRVGLKLANPFKYHIVKYIYATSSVCVPEAFILKSLSREAWCKESNWMGFVAVSGDETNDILGRRDILVAWRGSIQPLEWASDFEFTLVPATKLVGEDSKALVHQGFLSVYTSNDERSRFNKASARDQVRLLRSSPLVVTNCLPRS